MSRKLLLSHTLLDKNSKFQMQLTSFSPSFEKLRCGLSTLSLLRIGGLVWPTALYHVRRPTWNSDLASRQIVPRLILH